VEADFHMHNLRFGGDSDDAGPSSVAAMMPAVENGIGPPGWY
jgi:hypothetical protein